MVPLVDKDGVEDGDQGKFRKPHDHGVDYEHRIYTTVQAITEQVPKWLDGKPLFYLDIHCPGLRGGDDPQDVTKGTSEYFYFLSGNPDISDGKFVKILQRFGTILEKERQGTIPYRELNNLKYGAVSWHGPSNTSKRKPNHQGPTVWCRTFADVIFSATFELPFANAEGVVVNADSARVLGNDLARTIRVYLETLE
jgi:hypothetical protein